MTKKLPLHVKQQRKPISRACVFCHEKHLQCDSTRPCKNCVKREVADSCHDIQRKRSKTKNRQLRGVRKPGSKAGSKPNTAWALHKPGSLTTGNGSSDTTAGNHQKLLSQVGSSGSEDTSSPHSAGKTPDLLHESVANAANGSIPAQQALPQQHPQIGSSPLEDRQSLTMENITEVKSQLTGLVQSGSPSKPQGKFSIGVESLFYLGTPSELSSRLSVSNLLVAQDLLGSDINGKSGIRENHVQPSLAGSAAMQHLSTVELEKTNSPIGAAGSVQIEANPRASVADKALLGTAGKDIVSIGKALEANDENNEPNLGADVINNFDTDFNFFDSDLNNDLAVDTPQSNLGKESELNNLFYDGLNNQMIFRPFIKLSKDYGNQEQSDFSVPSVGSNEDRFADPAIASVSGPNRNSNNIHGAGIESSNPHVGNMSSTMPIPSANYDNNLNGHSRTTVAGYQAYSPNNAHQIPHHQQQQHLPQQIQNNQVILHPQHNQISHQQENHQQQYSLNRHQHQHQYQSQSQRQQQHQSRQPSDLHDFRQPYYLQHQSHLHPQSSASRKLSTQQLIDNFKRNNTYKSPLVIRKKVFQEVGDIYSKFPVFDLNRLQNPEAHKHESPYGDLKYIIGILSFSYMKSYQELIKYFYDRLYLQNFGDSGAEEFSDADVEKARNFKRKLFFKILEKIWVLHNYFRIQSALIQTDLTSLTNFSDSMLTELMFHRQLLNFENMIMNLTSTPAIIWRRSTEIVFMSDEICALIGIKNKARFLSKRRFLCEIIDDMSILNYFKLFNNVVLKNKEVGNYHNVNNRLDKLRNRFRSEDIDDLENELSDERINNGSGIINGGMIRFNCKFINQNYKNASSTTNMGKLQTKNSSIENFHAFESSFQKPYSQEINEELEAQQKFINSSSILTIKKDMFDIPLIIVGQFLPILE